MIEDDGNLESFDNTPRTTPWHDTEYVTVRREGRLFRLAYEVSKSGAITLLLPGGQKATMLEAEMFGWKPTEPERLRELDPSFDDSRESRRGTKAKKAA